MLFRSSTINHRKIRTTCDSASTRRRALSWSQRKHNSAKLALTSLQTFPLRQPRRQDFLPVHCCNPTGMISRRAWVLLTVLSLPAILLYAVAMESSTRRWSRCRYKALLADPFLQKQVSPTPSQTANRCLHFPTHLGERPAYRRRASPPAAPI